MGNNPGEFVRPHGITFGSSDNMYVTDMRNSSVQVLDKEFKLLTQWGSYDNWSGQFSLTFPATDLYENEGLVFVVDKLSNNVQAFDKHGKFLSKF